MESNIFFSFKNFSTSREVPESRIPFKSLKSWASGSSLTTMFPKVSALAITYPFFETLAGYNLNTPDSGK